MNPAALAVIPIAAEAVEAVGGAVGAATRAAGAAAGNTVKGPGIAGGAISAWKRGGRAAGRRFGMNAATRGRFQGIKESIYDHAWAVNAADEMLDRMLSRIDSKFGVFVHTINVTVQGGPQASLRRVWYLCLAAAFGRLRNRVQGVQAANIDATWDITGKACSVTLGYQNSGAIGGVLAGAGVKTTYSPLGPFQRGPDQITVGGSWPSFLTAFNIQSVSENVSTLNVVGGVLLPVTGAPLAVLGQLGNYIAGNGGASVTNIGGSAAVVPRPLYPPVFEIEGTQVPDQLIKFLQSYGPGPKGNLFVELPKGTGNGTTEFLPWARVLPLGRTVSGPYGSFKNGFTQLPTLPDDGRVITTGQKTDPRVQNPRPPVDGKTRGSLVSLVAQFLGNPGILPKSPPTGYVPLSAPGVYIYDPGQGLEDESVSNNKFTAAAITSDLDLPQVVPQPPTPADNGFGPDGYLLQQVVPNVRQ